MRMNYALCVLTQETKVVHPECYRGQLVLLEVAPLREFQVGLFNFFLNGTSGRVIRHLYTKRTQRRGHVWIADLVGQEYVIDKDMNQVRLLVLREVCAGNG